METGTAISQQGEKFRNNFDALRLLAAVLVAYTHSFDLLQKKSVDPIAMATNGAYGASYLGVILFFCISGYLVAQSLLNCQSGIEFVSKRLLRLFPAYAVVILLSAFVLGPLVSTVPVREYLKQPAVWEYLRSLDFVHLKNQLPGVFESNPYPNVINGSLWTMILEIVCYCILFIAGVFKLVRLPNHIFRWIILGFTVCIIIFQNPIIPGNLLWNYMDISYLMSYAAYFFVGACLFCFKDHVMFSKANAIGIAVLFCFSCFTGFNPYNLLGYLGIPFIVIYVANLKGWFNNFGKFGDYSYGMYLYAFPVQQLLVFLFKAAISPFVLFPLTLVITFIFAALSWHFIEKPALKLKKYLSFGARRSDLGSGSDQGTGKHSSIRVTADGKVVLEQ